MSIVVNPLNPVVKPSFKDRYEPMDEVQFQFLIIISNSLDEMGKDKIKDERIILLCLIDLVAYFRSDMLLHISGRYFGEKKWKGRFVSIAYKV